MSEYLSGAYALADARMRLTALPPDQGVLLLEGRDDVRLFGPYCISVDALVPCGTKRKLLQAYDALRPGEEARFLFVTDCDYDVPAGLLAPKRNLILTTHADVEIDLLTLGILERVIYEVVPEAVASGARAAQITETVRQRATALAETFGRFRLLSATNELGLPFDGLTHRRYRTPSSDEVDIEKLARTLHGRKPTSAASSAELAAMAMELEGGLLVCQGKDMLEAIRAVLHQDFGVELKTLVGLPSLIRLAASAGLMSQWRVVVRMGAWERQYGRHVLNPSVGGMVTA